MKARRWIGPLLMTLALAASGYAGWDSAAHGQAVTPRAAPSEPVAPAQTSAPSKVSTATPGSAHAHSRADVGRCATCHETLPDGRLRTRWAGKTLKPQSAWLGLAHDRDWGVRHRWVAADRGTLCAQCHKERECTQCHDARERPRAIHPNDWLTLHPQHARRSATDCQGCHSVQTFCMECHARLGISQAAAPEVRTPARTHPPASQWTGSINQHGREALRSLATCVSCHAERDCVRCHAAGLPSGARSPHPTRFRETCASALSQSSRACIACHGTDMDALRALCR